jgi:peptidoglycan hydrolase-like protein with peptidoglycan-binding domain
MEGDVPVIVTKPTLRKGASGPYVTECQEDLLKLGYDLSPYGADGKYGNTTIREVKKFQTASGLTADGICGPMTWAALDAAMAAASSSSSGSTGGTASGSASSQDSGSAPETPAPEPQRFTVHIPHLQRYEAEAYVASIPDAWMTEEGGETT